jgi:hypothetical protein
MDDAERRRNRLDPAVEGAARHGFAAPRGLGAAPSSRGGRFGRLFGALAPCDPGDDAIAALADRLEIAQNNPINDNTLIPAGFTYLSQFIDHDITFDPTSRLQRDNDPHALVNFRTPCFDLDSVYGSGPADQPFLYDWCCEKHPGVKLLVGHNPRDSRLLAPIDLPRNEQGRALVADGRNDENLIVSQLHLLFIQFHNKVVDWVAPKKPWLTCNELFDEARRIVRWHYQWIVMHDFLDTIVGKDMASAVRPSLALGNGVTTFVSNRRIYRVQRDPAMPVEFSGAAFRYGHSMVRSTYKLRIDTVPEVPILPAKGEEDKLHLGGFRPLRDGLRIDWRRFFGGAQPVHARNIDHVLTPALFSLPPDGAQLARLNLQRGRALGLPSGSDVARAMGVKQLSPEKLFPPISDEFRTEFWPPDVSPREREAVLRSPPLWFYLLREARTSPDGWQRLGPIAGRIVAEVLVGLLECDPQSYLRQAPMWTPELAAGNARAFTMRDLVEFTVPPEAPIQ